jgi:hypothetical protein
VGGVGGGAADLKGEEVGEELIPERGGVRGEVR